MKKSKVSSVYEGRRNKGSIEEKAMSSRTARMNARARKNCFRARNLNSLAASKQWMMNNFSNTTQKEKFVAAAENNNDNMKVINTEASDMEKKAEAVEEDQKAEMVNMNAKMEKWEEEGEWWEEWPLCWSYEEQQMWGGFPNNLQYDQDFIVVNIWNL